MSGGLLFLMLIVAGIASVLFWRYLRDRDHWHGTDPHDEPITYLNGSMAIRPTVLGHSVPEGYRQACAYFGVGLIDRTGTLDHGFPVKILDPIPTDFNGVAPMDALCAERAAALVTEARERGIRLRLLWSGGIDSTCAAVALLNVLGEDHSLLEVAYTDESVAEYPLFHRLLTERGVEMLKIKSAVSGLTASALNVTGEHGDQLFGSMLLEDLDEKDYFKPWQPLIRPLSGVELTDKAWQAMLDTLAPQTAACPLPVKTAFDWLWWANFSMKWQSVSERMMAPLPPEGRARIAPMMRHFFRTDDFQRWSLANHDKKIRDTWASYKYPLKDIIFQMTGDADYRDQKTKERSLRMLNAGGGMRHAAAITAGGLLLTQLVDRSILPATASSAMSWGE